MIFIWIIIGICCLSIVYSGMMIHRNIKVYNFRKALMELINEKCREDIIMKKDFKWRWQVFEEVTYNQMLKKFWKPLPEFYPDIKFVQSPDGVKNELN